MAASAAGVSLHTGSRTGGGSGNGRGVSVAGGGDFIDRISLITGTAGMCGVTGSSAGCGGDGAGVHRSVRKLFYKIFNLN